LARSLPLVEAVPCVAFKAAKHNIGDNRPDAQRLAGKLELQGATNEGTSTISTDQVPASHVFYAFRAGKLRKDTPSIPLEANQLALISRRFAELGQPLAHRSFRPHLRDHQRSTEGLLGGGRRDHDLSSLLEVPSDL
jgi:hypothetical protein